MLSKRLAAVAAMVRQGSRVADIGTDHAYLPVHLAENGTVPSAIASELRKGPCAAAQKTVAAAGLADKIAVRLGDGLSSVSPDEVDDIVIPGMGGETIAAILAAAPWVRDGRLRLILQPMSKLEALHAFLMTGGFAIDEEITVRDGHDYVVLRAHFADLPPIDDPFLFWRGAFSVPDGRDYWQKTAAYLKVRAAHGEPQLADIAARLAAL